MIFFWVVWGRDLLELRNDMSSKNRADIYFLVTVRELAKTHSLSLAI